MALNILTIQIAREETHCYYFMGYSFRLVARDLLNAPSHSRIAHTMAYGNPVVEHWMELELA